VPRNEDGEFELILGNRQLLSVFFIIVILLGVFFTMGYIVGRNSAPLTELTSTTKQEAKPIVVDPAPRQQEAPKPEAPPPAAVKETAAQQPPETVETKKPTPLPKFEPPDKKAESKKAAGGPVLSEPVVGATYLQLIAAPDKDTCDVMVSVLRGKKFSAMAMEIPEKAGWCRVLVGPLAEGAYNSTKKQLLDLGLPANNAIRKTF
jgi:hypothetical protein